MKRFTLIELLIVVTIILLLIALLMTAVRKAKKAVKLVSCSNNLRQQFTSLVLYQNDYISKPLDNHRINKHIGIDSTYFVKYNQAFGLSYPVMHNYLPAELLYCPKWSHPWLQLHKSDKLGHDVSNVKNGFGGWYSSAKLHIGISYHYKYLDTDSPYKALIVDHFIKREVHYGFTYGHKDVYNAAYNDGHVDKIYDDGYMISSQPRSTNRNWKLQDKIFNNFFDK